MMTVTMQDLDEAVLRRFSKRIYVRLPSKEDRVCLLQKLLALQYNELTEHEIHQVQGLPPAEVLLSSGTSSLSMITGCCSQTSLTGKPVSNVARHR
jgi:SpoVK/Ycf46/Vps4 family AAA+-type ATPase